MSKKQVGDNLAADAALAVEHTPEREAEQRAYFGGDIDDIDDFDATGLDDGSDPNFTAPPASDDADTEDKDDDGADSEDDSNSDEDKEEGNEEIQSEESEKVVFHRGNNKRRNPMTFR